MGTALRPHRVPPPKPLSAIRYECLSDGHIPAVHEPPVLEHLVHLSGVMANVHRKKPCEQDPLDRFCYIPARHTATRAADIERRDLAPVSGVTHTNLKTRYRPHDRPGNTDSVSAPRTTGPPHPPGPAPSVHRSGDTYRTDTPPSPTRAGTRRHPGSPPLSGPHTPTALSKTTPGHDPQHPAEPHPHHERTRKCQALGVTDRTVGEPRGSGVGPGHGLQRTGTAAPRSAEVSALRVADRTVGEPRGFGVGAGHGLQRAGIGSLNQRTVRAVEASRA